MADQLLNQVLGNVDNSSKQELLNFVANQQKQLAIQKTITTFVDACWKKVLVFSSAAASFSLFLLFSLPAFAD